MDGRSIIAEPDLMAIMGDTVTLVEYKLHDSHMARVRAEEQLEKAQDYLVRFGFRYDKVRKIYIPGDGYKKKLRV